MLPNRHAKITQHAVDDFERVGGQRRYEVAKVLQPVQFRIRIQTRRRLPRRQKPGMLPGHPPGGLAPVIIRRAPLGHFLDNERRPAAFALPVQEVGKGQHAHRFRPPRAAAQRVFKGLEIGKHQRVRPFGRQVFRRHVHRGVEIAFLNPAGLDLPAVEFRRHQDVTMADPLHQPRGLHEMQAAQAEEGIDRDKICERPQRRDAPAG